jgi:hypothetical protein
LSNAQSALCPSHGSSVQSAGRAVAAMAAGEKVLREDLRREYLHRVTGQDRLGVPARCPGHRPVPAQQVGVHNVVVHQREVVHYLRSVRGRHRRAAVAADGPCRGQNRCRTKCLAPAAAVWDAVPFPPSYVVAADMPHRVGQHGHCRV